MRKQPVHSVWFGLGGVLIVLLAACAGPSPPPPTPSLPPVTPTPSFAPTPTVAAPPALPVAPAFSVGQPSYVGRGGLLAAAFLPAGRGLILGWAHGLTWLEIHPTDRGLELRERFYHALPAPLLALAISPAGEQVAAALADGQVAVLGLTSGEVRLFPVTAPSAYACGLAWSPQGTHLALQCIGPERGDPLSLLEIPSGKLTTVPNSRIPATTLPQPLWTPDGQAVLLAALTPPCSRFLQILTGEPRLTLQTNSTCLPPYALAWTPSGRALAVGDAQGVTLLDGRSGAFLGRFEGAVVPFSPPPFPAPTQRLVYNPRGTRLAALGSLGLDAGAPPTEPPATRVWEVSTRRLLASLPVGEHEPLALTFDPADDGTLWLFYADGRFTRWPYARRGAAEEVLYRWPVEWPLPPLTISADGRYVAADLTTGGAALWAITTGTAPTLRFEAPLRHPVLAPHGETVLLVHPTNAISLVYAVATQRTVMNLPGAQRGRLGAAFAPDGTRLAYGNGPRLHVVRWPEGVEETVLAGFPPDQVITRVLWSPDGQALAAASGLEGQEVLGTLRVWRRTADGTWQAVAESRSVRTGYTNPALIAFSPQGHWVALEVMPTFEASALGVQVVDLIKGAVVLDLSEQDLIGWVDASTLLTHAAQNDTRMVLWAVPSGAHSPTAVTTRGDEAYLPARGVLARPALDRPHVGRQIEILAVSNGERLARLEVGADVLWIAWTPSGDHLLALTTTGALYAWPITWEK
ncbi:hypothetical protein [uncultured Thermanaerothrix sp.]|uniref:WD40 repeat domain-containing protein n=1 Tax=uncultured Thermanaerothrix sp. TaxID=1195149 RepID=UPI002610B132|nr:hypothetical protein [uncultured Thermanaerothrix sp.]